MLCEDPRAAQIVPVDLLSTAFGMEREYKVELWAPDVTGKR